MKSNSPLFRKKLSPAASAAQKPLTAAIAAVRDGQLAAGLAHLKSGGGAALKTPVGQNVLGDILLKQGDAAGALKAFEAAVRLAPSMPEAHCNRGTALEAIGRLEDALAAEDRAITLRPAYPAAHFNRGNILRAMLRLEAAIGAYDVALRHAADFADALLNRGMCQLALDRPMQALADFDRVIRLNPRHVAALSGRAAAFRDLGEHDQALGAIGLALAADPDNRDVAIVRCGVLLAMERFEEALAASDALLARERSGDMLALRANALQRLGRREDALADAEEAVRLMPDSHEAHSALGIVLCDLGRLDEALGELDKARALGASGSTFHSWRGVALSGYGDLQEALVELDRAVELAPGNASARFNRAMTRLASGDFGGGWEDYEARLGIREHRTPAALEVGRRWTGAEDIAGKKVLAYAEQGHGDTLQLIRFLPRLVERAGNVTLVCPEPTRLLMQANFPDVDVTDKVAFRQDFDFHVSVMSLPACFRTTLETLPRDVPYLSAEPARVETWRARLGDGFKVGLIWQGNPKYGRDRDRSIRLAHYAPLAAVPGVRFISLQSYSGIDQLADPPQGMTIETLGEEIVNNPDGFREVAAVMMSLDLIITSDTGPAHLAGALGRPVWTALMAKPDWRWMRDRPDTPWYPTMRLFRQKTPGDWPGVFDDIAAELAAKLAAGVADVRGG